MEGNPASSKKKNENWKELKILKMEGNPASSKKKNENWKELKILKLKEKRIKKKMKPAAVNSPTHAQVLLPIPSQTETNIYPTQIIIEAIKDMPTNFRIADISGAGVKENYSRRLPHTIQSFTLTPTSKGYQAVDAAMCPLPAGSIDAGIFRLYSLQVAECRQLYIVECNRVLVLGGLLVIISEEKQTNSHTFVWDTERSGFKLIHHSTCNGYTTFKFIKIRSPPSREKKVQTKESVRTK